MHPVKVRIIHETNPKKYFPAVFKLCEEEENISLVAANRYSVVKEWFRAWLRDKTPFKQRTKNALSDLALRMKLCFIRDEVIIVGFAPWDWRILIYSKLLKRNTIVYHTSWHDWREQNVPRQIWSKTVQKLLIKKWRQFLEHDHVKIVAVTNLVADSVGTFVDKDIHTIPHAVPEIFFEKGKSRKANKSGTLKLLNVGELSEKKGIRQLITLMTLLKDEDISLTIVGAGPLDTLVNQENLHINYLGAIYEREKVASLMAEHDLLLLLSQKTTTWEELFGIVIIEALATGCDIICSDHVGPREILAQSPVGHIVEECDIHSVMNNVMKIKNQKNNELGSDRIEFANKYSTSNISQEWHRILG